MILIGRQGGKRFLFADYFSGLLKQEIRRDQVDAGTQKNGEIGLAVAIGISVNLVEQLVAHPTLYSEHHRKMALLVIRSRYR